MKKLSKVIHHKKYHELKVRTSNLLKSLNESLDKIKSHPIESCNAMMTDAMDARDALLRLYNQNAEGDERYQQIVSYMHMDDLCELVSLQLAKNKYVILEALRLKSKMKNDIEALIDCIQELTAYGSINITLAYAYITTKERLYLHSYLIGELSLPFI